MMPTFLICGAAKSGTTSLWQYLNVHPEVGLASIKEPNFFSTAVGIGNKADPIQSRIPGQYWRGMAWYEILFKHCAGKKAIGEASVMYMPEAESAGLIRQALPQATLIFVLRNPVERLISHYWHEVRDHRPVPALETMIREQHPTLKRYLYISSYHLHIQRYAETFPKEQMAVYLYDDLAADRRKFVQQVFQRIGVNADFVPPNIDTRFHEAYQSRFFWLQRFGAWADAQWKFRSGAAWPEWLLKSGQKLMQLNRQPMQRATLPDEMRQTLADELRPGHTLAGDAQPAAKRGPDQPHDRLFERRGGHRANRRGGGADVSQPVVKATP